MASEEVVNQAATAFRQYLPDLTTPRFMSANKQTPYEYTAAFQSTQHPPWLFNLTETWKELLEEPFQGITNDGVVRAGLFQAQENGCDIDEIHRSAFNFLDAAGPDLKEKVSYPLAAREWRCWSNPEFLLRPLGVRLEELPEELIEAILRVVEASLSPEGYQKALAAMRTNHFLGELCNIPKIMNKHSYNFLLFGKPSTTESWGWSLYGHHLCLSVFLQGSHITISPTFTGAEPNIIDSGAFAGTQILHLESQLGLQLMQSLPEPIQQQAQTYKLLRDPAMLQTGDLKTDRWNQDDQRHLCGAFRDNRIVPYEGVLVQTTFTAEQQTLLLTLIEHFILYLPLKARTMRLAQIRQHFDETFFSWIGGFGDEDAFYFRVQSPVVVCEFDHHSGVFLTNAEPAKFHTHAVVRTPNGGDYGGVLRGEGEGSS